MDRVMGDHSFTEFTPISYKDRFGVAIDTSKATCTTSETKNRSVVRTNIDDTLISRSVPVAGVYVRPNRK